MNHYQFFGLVIELLSCINLLQMLWQQHHIQMRGISATDLQIHLDVFAFRRNIRADNDSVWNKLCLVIGEMQSLVSKPNF